MPERDWERSILRVHSFGGVRASELRQLLSDVEYAYNGISGFDYFLSRLESGHRFWRRHLPWPEMLPLAPGPLGLDREQVASLVPLRRGLYVHRVKLESPGFWDFLRRTFSLEAIDQWLTARQERKEQRRQEPHRRRMDDLDYEDRVTEVVLNRYRAAREMGFSDDDLTPLANELVSKPLSELEKHQDSGLIERTELLELPPPEDEEEHRF